VAEWLDVATVTLVITLSIANNLWQHSSSEATAWWAQLIVALPLLARRRFPTEVLLATAAVAVAQFLYSGAQAGELALLVALYSVGAHERRRWVAIGSAAVALIAGAAAVIAWSPDDNTLQTVVLLDGTVTAAMITGVYTRTRRAYLRSVLDRAATAERERDQQALTIRAVERDQLSREIHDIVAHNLSVMIALSDGALVALDRNPPAARDAIEQSTATGRQALDEIRRLLGVLRDHTDPELGPQPGFAELDRLVAGVRAADLPVELIIAGRPPETPPGAQLAVYRIIQEGLTNVLKHAPTASEARVELAFDKQDIRITITNDGLPRPARSESGRQPGHGLTGMRERAAVFTGEVEAGRYGSQKWRVRARLVVPTAPSAASGSTAAGAAS
jgi:signal transduction histidine kinase